ncbi:PerC family transcriptional regulator [Escherichia coli]|uniref:PerC family transcriptional regulator n=1 Tax=Escherichia coli TaxID=562 RepID=UPI0022277E35|nr:PerC family transcriptional regulator [Escherichia coli]MCW3359884.1 PerC family transcriptional regulator [Escherichia coli]
MTLTVTVFRSEGGDGTWPHSGRTRGEGFYRRAAARWGEVMLLVGDRQGTASGYDATAGMFRKAQKPPEPPDNFGDLRKAVDRTYAEMGIDGVSDEIWRKCQDR